MGALGNNASQPQGAQALLGALQNSKEVINGGQLWKVKTGRLNGVLWILG
ncbi:hypothetical protein U5F72_21305 [Stenotrophomonas muris]|uniref:Uncharacterized protein n=1 Tax=Stenotrophomonas muris TaxID=2963283 RepID=A0ABU5MNL0_9GAMM|nr:hypothetical protein [Stenotrophomonas muris]MDZ7514344.1 hypothetical protein [Stenotrophomonas muris]